MHSPDGVSPVRWLLAKELRDLAASRSYWLLLLVVGALVGQAFITSVAIYAEASGSGGGPAALSQGLRPLEGFVVPTLGAYDLAATLLFPFVVIRLVSSEKQTGSLALSLQMPVSFNIVILAKGIALMIGWLVAGIAGAIALLLWRAIGGHLGGPETWTVVFGYVLRGLLTIGIGVAAAAVSASAASAAIVALTVTLGTWALDYLAAARGGVVATIAQYTPSAALRVFEHGELRLSIVLIFLTLSVGGMAVAAIWLREGTPKSKRGLQLGTLAVVVALLCAAFSQLRWSRDVSEDRRNSLPRADELALRDITQPLHITVYLAADDPRLVDLERGVFAKLRRTMHDVRITYAANGRTGLFERPNTHYGEIWYDLGGKRSMSRSSTEPIVLETIYGLIGRASPTPIDAQAYSGYPLAAQSTAAPWIFFFIWPVCVIAVWWLLRRPRLPRFSPELLESNE